MGKFFTKIIGGSTNKSGNETVSSNVDSGSGKSISSIQSPSMSTAVSMDHTTVSTTVDRVSTPSTIQKTNSNMNNGVPNVTSAITSTTTASDGNKTLMRDNSVDSLNLEPSVRAHNSDNEYSEPFHMLNTNANA